MGLFGRTLCLFPENELGVVEWYVSVFMQFVGMILLTITVHGKDGSNIHEQSGVPRGNNFGEIYKALWCEPR